MSRLGFKSVVYHGDTCLGEVDVLPAKNQLIQFPNNEIRINHLSPSSERCIPLSILQTISPFSIRCKLESNSSNDKSQLIHLHYSCFHELKTAIVLLGDEEFHLVAMPSKEEKFPCFWCFTVPLGLYNYCLGMLNLRCLAIVFDLDETLIVANTMKSFEDKIEALKWRISCENDPLRVTGMSAELKRYVDDQSLLKQYTDGDFVMDNGKLLKVQHEEVPQLSSDQERVVRPVIRLQDKNVVLTRINPEIRDTSVLVRLRPAWEDLRSYLTAKGRKRFEVYVCTMAEKDYALEMWRLLDPELHLISSKQLLERVVCVKSGSRKSLLNVFQDRVCHPKMAMVIDDRLKVWDDKDQPRVHVVPAFIPYYAPQAETANAVPVLCVARNVACNVRAGFFKEFDENLLRKIPEVCYEDDAANLPYPPDVSDYLMTEDAGFVPIYNKDAPIPEGISGAEVNPRLNRVDIRNAVDSTTPSLTNNNNNNNDTRPGFPQQLLTIPQNSVGPAAASRSFIPSQKPILPGASAKREVNPSALNLDARRGLLVMQHGQDTREKGLYDPLFPSRPLAQLSTSSTQSRGGWLVEEDSSTVQPKNRTVEMVQDIGAQDKQRAHQSLFRPNIESSVTSGAQPHPSQMKSEQAYLGHERQKQNNSQLNQSSLSERDKVTLNQGSINVKDLQTERKGTVHSHSLYIGVLQEIGRRCGSNVEYKFDGSTSRELQFSVEVWYNGEKTGVGKGRTRRDAQTQAAENALKKLAEKYVAYIAPDSGAVGKDLDQLSLENDNGFVWDIDNPGLDKPHRGALPNLNTCDEAAEEARFSNSNGNHQLLKRSNSPRSPQTTSTKRPKDEIVSGLSSSQYQKNGNPVS